MRRIVNDENNIITRLEEIGISKVFAEDNKAYVMGQISRVNGISYGKNEKFQEIRVEVPRTSGKSDFVLIRVPCYLISKDVSLDRGQWIEAAGEYRSFVRNGRKKMFVYVKWIFFHDEKPALEGDYNLVYINGYICNEPLYKRVYSGFSELSAFCVAVQRKYSTSNKEADYIHCIAWGDDVSVIRQLDIGQKIGFYGRIQSRVFYKHSSNENISMPTEVNEVSIIQIKKIE